VLTASVDALLLFPTDLAKMVADRVKAFDLGGTPDDALKEIGTVLSSFAILKAQLMLLGETDISDQTLVDFLSYMNSIGFAVEDAAQSMIEYASVLKVLNLDISDGLTMLWEYAKAQEFTNSELSNFITTVGAFASLSTTLGLTTSLDELTAISKIVGDITKKNLDSAQQDALAQQAADYGPDDMTVEEARVELEKMGIATKDAILEVTNQLVFMDRALDIAGTSFKDLGFSLLTAVERTQAFLDKVGGLEKWEEAVSNFYQNFFTQQEQFDRLTKELTKSLAAHNQVLPETRMGYRELVNTAAKTNEDLYQALIQLSPLAAAYFDGIEQQAENALNTAKETEDLARKALQDAFDIAKNEVDESFRRLQASVDAEKNRINKEFEDTRKQIEAKRERINESYRLQIELTQKTVDELSDSVSKLRNLSETLHSWLDRLQKPGFEEFDRTQAQAQIKSVLAVARAGGGLPINGEIDKSLDVLSRPSEHLFSTFVDYQRDFLLTANDIGALS
jgi:hypothetical protein